MNRIIARTSRVSLVIALFSIGPAEAAEAGRDPFRPVSAQRCSQRYSLQKWQLKGVMGSGEKWVGWLTQSEGEWLKLTRGEAIPPGNWRVSHLDRSGAILTPTDQADVCDGAPADVALVSPFITKPVMPPEIPLS
ncbi:MULTISPECIES: HofP DNA utilization family protein [unclassified Brenneria]|uniref:HofP DNA utilization family protein n=1 Tax=unclassified Brenneria TaxID=2634434 RepID=UPI002EC890E9|nr:HofP DNA utilization family protein [Brenneria sp. HEZEL_4_2_4]